MVLKATAMTLAIGSGAKRIAHNALTFIEILLVIIIIGILIGIALPSFRKTFNNLQLNNFSRELQSFMNYLHERSIVEGKIIYLNIDNELREAWAQMKDKDTDKDIRLKTLRLPDKIKIETQNYQILFYPDGSIDKLTLDVVNQDSQKITLTTQGVYGGVKILAQE